MAPSLADLGSDLRPEAIVYEDEDLIVVDKPAGVPSQAADAGHDDDLPARLKRFLAARRGVDEGEIYLGVHQRLDKETSGLVLYTLRREANAGIAAQFEGSEIRKRYLAAVSSLARLEREGETRLEHDLLRGRDGRMQVVAPDTPGARKARTRVSLLRRQGERALLQLDCDTGRTHQLRVQLAHVGAPIAGDRLYGGASAMRLLLHAHQLELRHPRDGRPLRFTAAPPLELEHWLAHGALQASSESALFDRALQLALETRYRLGRSRNAAAATTAFRLLHGAAEGSDDLAVDFYGGFLVAHFFAEPNAVLEARVLDALHALGSEGVYLKRHLKQKNELGDARDSRFAPPAPARGHAAPEDLVVHEHGLPFGVKLGEGLRTGLFLDQRDNRKRVSELAQGKRVLNLFAYTGGFSVAALAGGATHVVSVDASRTALNWAERNVARVSATDRHRVICADVLDAIGRLARQGERFDLLIVDPPSYSKTRTHRFIAEKDYAKLCEACIAVLAPKGAMLCCINHHKVSRAKLRQMVLRGVRATGRSASRLRDLPAPLDFPAAQDGEPESKSVLLECD